MKEYVIIVSGESRKTIENLNRELYDYLVRSPKTFAFSASSGITSPIYREVTSATELYAGPLLGVHDDEDIVQGYSFTINFQFTDNNDYSKALLKEVASWCKRFCDLEDISISVEKTFDTLIKPPTSYLYDAIATGKFVKVRFFGRYFNKHVYRRSIAPKYFVLFLEEFGEKNELARKLFADFVVDFDFCNYIRLTQYEMNRVLRTCKLVYWRELNELTDAPFRVVENVPIRYDSSEL